MKNTVTAVFLALAMLAGLSSCLTPVNRAGHIGTEDAEQVSSEFDPVDGKAYMAYIFVQYVSADGFAGSGNFSDGVFVSYKGADEVFNIFDTALVFFDGADYKVETRTFRLDGNLGDYTTRQTIGKVISARKSSYEAGEPVYDKPIIYFYPEEDTVCSVTLEVSGGITCSYPEYTENGWTNFTAKTDGTLVFPDGREYYALYWEGRGTYLPDMTEGFCVKGEDTAGFLYETLKKCGLNEKETNEFIIYWLPRMQENRYNLISFQTEAYTDSARLTVTPEPDTLIRVFMAFKPLVAPVDIAPQTLEAPQRTGFTVVEWGGCEIK